MQKFVAIINLLAGTIFALIGGIVVLCSGKFLSAAPRDHLGLVAWAFIIITVGLYLVIAGLGRVHLATSNLNQRRS